MLLLFVITLHLVIMFLFLRSGDNEQQSLQRDQVIQKIINAIYLVEATPVANREAAVKAMADPDLQVSFTAKPKWGLQFKEISFWRISNALRKDIGSFSLSLQLDKNQWLNVKATIESHIITRQLVWFTAEIFIFGSIFLVIWMTNRYHGPLEEFRKAAERLGSDVEVNSFDINGPTVIRETAQALNDMQQRIQDLIRDRTQMLAAISHDLRTPITRLKIRSQFITDQVQQQNLINDFDEMEHMIAEILAFARDDANKEEKKSLDIISLLYSIINDFRDMGHTIEFSSKLKRQQFFGRSIAIKRAFTNLVGNAVKYSQTNGKIYVRGHTTPHGTLQLIVEDQGIGIPKDRLSEALEPFGQVNRPHDSSGIQGTGLGLPIAKAMAELHGGSLTLESDRNQGTKVIIELPAFRIGKGNPLKTPVKSLVDGKK